MTVVDHGHSPISETFHHILLASVHFDTITSSSRESIANYYSIVLLSPLNQILLLHRVKTSSSFPSAHVFPGGNVDVAQDGELPPESFERHVDNQIYRLAAIRECFEESGLLLARDRSTGKLVGEVPEAEREAGRHDVHAGRVKFVDWVQRRGAEPDTDGLMPFTRFITPTTVPKRFTTQMYVYFMSLGPSGEAIPEAKDGSGDKLVQQSSSSKTVIPTPTSDGGVEHTAAQFLYAQQWLDMMKKDEVIMYPPQVYLCHLLAPFFPEGDWSVEQLQAQREKFLEFIKTGEPPWAEKVMSPDFVLGLEDGRAVLGLKKPGVELEGSGRSGDAERVIVVRNSKEGPRDVMVRWKQDVMKEWREQQGKEKGKI